MHKQYRAHRILLLFVVAALASVAATTARADTGTAPAPDSSQLVDTSHQVTQIQQQIAQLQAKGQTARAGKLTAAAASACGFQNASQVFLPWGDPASYALAPQGDLSTTTGWSFKHVTVATDHDPYTAGAGSLLFAQGDSEAVTPAMCVDLTNPTIRLFMKDTGGNGKSDIKVDVLYGDLQRQHPAPHPCEAPRRLGVVTVDHDSDWGQHPLRRQRERCDSSGVRLQGRGSAEERDALARQLLRRSVPRSLRTRYLQAAVSAGVGGGSLVASSHRAVVSRAEAAMDVVVDHADVLHERVHARWADEAVPLRLQLLRERLRVRGRGWQVSE